MKIAWVVVCLLLGGCATPPHAPEAPAPLLQDALFSPPAEPVDRAAIFAVSEDMREYMRQRIRPLARDLTLVNALGEALYKRDQLSLDYDSAVTRTAAQAFTARSGNCLSLAVMTAAFAHELGLQVRYQSVEADETWARAGDLYLAIGHVNLLIGPPLSAGNRTWSPAGDWVTIDFLPARDLRGRKTEPISEQRVVAMFMNNRAAEAIAGERLNDAYAWARAAVLEDPEFVAAYNTLGLVYLRRGALAPAESVFRSVLALEPHNTHAMGNLVLALQRQERDDEAAVVAAQLKRLQPDPPYALFYQGQQALLAGDYRRAATLLDRALDRSADYHEVHYWLAIALAKLGQNRAASEHLEAAMKNSTSRETTALYAAKLQKLKAARGPG